MRIAFYCDPVQVRVYKKHALAQGRTLSNYVAHVMNERHFRVVSAERVRNRG